MTFICTLKTDQKLEEWSGKIVDLEFTSQKGIKLLADALQKLLNSRDKKDISIKAFMAEDQF